MKTVRNTRGGGGGGGGGGATKGAPVYGQTRSHPGGFTVQSTSGRSGT